MSLDSWEVLLEQAFFLVLLLSALPLGCSMLVGLVVGVLQAATQVQEQTLSFVPKALAVAAVLYFAGPYCSAELVRYLSGLLGNLHLLLRGI